MLSKKITFHLSIIVSGSCSFSLDEFFAQKVDGLDSAVNTSSFSETWIVLTDSSKKIN